MQKKKAKKTKVQVVKIGKNKSFKVRRGALHKALGIPSNEVINQAKLNSALNSTNPETRREARSAKGLEAMNHSR